MLRNKEHINDMVDKELLITALKEILEYPVNKDIEDGWHYQRQSAYQKAYKLLKEIEK